MSEASPHDIQELGGRYAIERELGQGGTSTVYLAHDRVYDRRVAVKVLRRELAISLGADRFLREIRVTARLNHPHIAPIIDSGVGDGIFYFITTYLDGGTLRERLDRERQLPIEEALGITRAIAGALDHAHAQGVLHCDVKPENILFSNGEAFLTDFGIARLFEAGHDGTTSTGIVRGTPAYMSPEQAGGEKGYDGRTDVYSLACVLYEALAGVAAFVAATPQAVLAQRFLHAPRDLRVYRATVPRHVEAAIARAMSLSPDDRFATAGEFARALRDKYEGSTPDAVQLPEATRGAAPVPVAPSRQAPRWLSRPALALGGIGVATVVSIGTWMMRSDGRPFGDSPADGVAFDTAPTVVFPFARDSVRDAFSGEDLYLHDALVRWRGLRVVETPRARALYAQRDSSKFGIADARRLAREAGARRFIWGRLVDRGGATTLVASIYDTRGEAPIRSVSVAVPAEVLRDSVFDYLASALAFGPSRSLGATGLAGTRSAAARMAYSRGIAAVTEWDLLRADTAFAEALTADPDYSQALLWRAQVAGWRGDGLPAWRELAADALQRETFLGARDRALARALYFHSSGQHPKACPIYQQLAATDAQDFAAWYGLGGCLRDDRMVVRDSTSPSGWRFRTSYGAALRAFQRAFILLPAVSHAYRSRAFSPLQALFFTQSARLRPGSSEDGTAFGAYAAWLGDTLAFIPYPLSLVASTHPSAAPVSATQAIEHNRRVFRAVAEAWVQAQPRDAAMHEALAIALDLSGSPNSVVALQQAVTLAPATERIGLLASLAWLRAKHACRASNGEMSEAAKLREARQLADSVLQSVSPDDAARHLSPLLGLAALVGRPALAGDLARRYSQPVVFPLGGRRVTVSARIVGTSTAFLAYAAAGAPKDSIVELARRADAAIRSDLSEDVQDEARDAFLTRPARLAFASAGLLLHPNAFTRRDYLLAAQEALVKGSAARVDIVLREVRASRRHLLPADLTFDTLLPEAWLLAAEGKRDAALAWLTPSLDALAEMPPQLIEDGASIAALVRAMAFRASLTTERKDARAWAQCAETFWENAEPSVRQLLVQGHPPNGQ